MKLMRLCSDGWGICSLSLVDQWHSYDRLRDLLCLLVCERQPWCASVIGHWGLWRHRIRLVELVSGRVLWACWITFRLLYSCVILEISYSRDYLLLFDVIYQWSINMLSLLQGARCTSNFAHGNRQASTHQVSFSAVSSVHTRDHMAHRWLVVTLILTSFVCSGGSHHCHSLLS